MIVCGAGTGGTVAGIGRKVKEELPSCKVRRGWRERERAGRRKGGRERKVGGGGEREKAQCRGKVDMVVCGAGIGGTVVGIGKKVKEQLPSCKVRREGGGREREGRKERGREGEGERGREGDGEGMREKEERRGERVPCCVRWLTDICRHMHMHIHLVSFLISVPVKCGS